MSNRRNSAKPQHQVSCGRRTSGSTRQRIRPRPRPAGMHAVRFTTMTKPILSDANATTAIVGRQEAQPHHGNSAARTDGAGARGEAATEAARDHPAGGAAFPRRCDGFDYALSAARAVKRRTMPIAARRSRSPLPAQTQTPAALCSQCGHLTHVCAAARPCVPWRGEAQAIIVAATELHRCASSSRRATPATQAISNVDLSTGHLRAAGRDRRASHPIRR